MQTLNRSEKHDLYNKLARIALPIAVQGVGIAILNLVDNIMVGSLGEAPLAAVGISIQLYFVHYLLLYGFVGGTTTFTAQFYGTGDKESIRKIIGFSAICGLIIGVVFFIVAFFFTEEYLRLLVEQDDVRALAADYVKICSWTLFMAGVSYPLQMGLKATQQTKMPMIIGLSIFFLNIIMNYVLIFGKFGFPQWGVYGAGFATMMSRALELVLSVVFVFNKRNYFHGPLCSYFQIERKLVKDVLKNSAPTTAHESIWAIGQSVYIAAFSRLGTSAIAGYQAATTLRSIFSFAAFSIGDSALIMVGEKLGMGDKKGAKILASQLIKIGVIVGLIVGAVMVGSAWSLTGLFHLTEYGAKCCAYVLMMYGITMWLNLFTGINVSGILRAGGDTSFAMISECSCIWLVGVPIAFFTSIICGWPIYICTLLAQIDNLAKMAILAYRFRSGKWIKMLVRDKTYV